MQFTTAAVLAMVADVLALPPTVNQDLEQSPAEPHMAHTSQNPCGDFMRKAVCCRRSIFGLIDMGCHPVKPDIHTGPGLAAACAAKKKLPRCCILGFLGIYGPCKPPYAVAQELGYYDGDEYEDVEVIVTDPEWE
ncbi:hypothetical protein INS49_009812 [Diaporthe citri]|uniref:uncharacterized protein n=1 Tax=Diaporthe citri TaxID=83186 RepID=UPI001C7F386E|nr:uncharacterized protein INS49_009812 [Diaporthe citri]KAG6361585.1 hypothetical protein INS49_009812 [Diaporthe citri]